MTTFLQLSVAGFALGCVYALIALGFTIVLLAGVVNFAQGSFMLLGAYTVSWLAIELKLNFILAIVLGAALTALTGIAFEQFVLRRMSARPVFTIIMITLGLDIIMQIAIMGIWGYDQRPNNGDPFGLSSFNVGEINFRWADIWTVATTIVLLVVFFLFFKYSKFGVAMRATAIDHEAAAAIGISLPQVFLITWAIAGLVATVGGVFLAASPRSLDADLGLSAFRAFPAIILGGLGSTVGAVAGGLILGMVEVLVGGYENNFPFVGQGFHSVASFVVLLLVLLVRPYGLFGKKEVERV